LYNNKFTAKACEYLRDLLLFDNKSINLNEKINDSSYLLGNKSIKKLYLGTNNIRSKGISFISEALKINTTLEYLGLNYSEIEDEGIGVFAENLILNNFSSLKFLHLGHNIITNKHMEKFFSALEKCKLIEEISLEFNLLKDDCVDFIILFMEKNKNIKKILLNNNLFTDDAVLKIFDFLNKNKNEENNKFNNLEMITLSNDKISENVRNYIYTSNAKSKFNVLKIKKLLIN
jgi:hypothetical protein